MSEAAEAIHAMLDAFSPKVKRDPPCKCGAYKFPHRYGKACEAFERWLIEDRWQSEKNDRDLDVWAQRSRG